MARVAVVGLGVGYALACCLAEAGYNTVGIDINPEAVGNPRMDASTKRLVELDHQHRRNIGRLLRLSTDYMLLKNVDQVIICVSTGDEKKLVLGHVEDATRSCCAVMQGGATLMVYSTLPFGSSKRIKKTIEDQGLVCDTDIRLVINPLMIAQGSVAEDFVNPPFVAFGAYSKESAQLAMQFYSAFIRASSLWKKSMPPMFVTSPETAELAKLTANAFLCMKMSFANMTAELCGEVGVNPHELLRIVGSDWRIGEKMLKAGYAWGGACFPRDLQSLIETYKGLSVPCPLLNGATESNEWRLKEPLRRMRQLSIKSGKVLVLGRSYKTNVPMTSGSPSLKLVGILAENGYNVTTYDPLFDEEAAKPNRAFNVVIVTTPHPQFPALISEQKKNGAVILDYRLPA